MSNNRKRQARSGNSNVDLEQNKGKLQDNLAVSNGRASRCALFNWRLVLLAVLVLLFVLLAPFTAKTRSIAIMSINDFYSERKSLPYELGLTLELPLKNMDFYPLMVTYNDDLGMSTWLGKPVRFTVDYAVADFSFLSSHSGIYDVENPLYNTYVGAYYLSGLGKPVDQQTVLQIASFDQRCLALPALGLDSEHAVFNAAEVRKENQRITLSGCDFDRYDAAIITNGPEHKKESFKTGYILFGDPPLATEQYPLRAMAGRIYVTYLDNLDLTIGLYILAKDDVILAQIDRQVLSGTRLTWKAL